MYKDQKMNKRMNKQQTTPVTDTFKGMLLMSMGVPVGNIRPYRLKSAPSCLGGFERMSVAAAPAVFHKWMPVWMFETAFEPVPEQRRGDRIRTLTEEMNNHHVAEKALNEKCYALSVKLLSECGGSLDDNGEQSSTYLHVVDRDPVELVITNASLRKDGKIFIMGYSYYTGEEYEQECDVESGMDILNFILSQKSFECHE